MHFLTDLSTAVSAFIATNLDDLVLLVLCFAQAHLRRQQIVEGQYLGFGLLVFASLPGFFGSLLLPRPWIGMLGLVPLILGLSHWLEPSAEPAEPVEPVEPAETQCDETTEVDLPSFESASFFSRFLSPQTYSIAMLTVANGSDNIAVYLPLLAHCTWVTLVLTLIIFFTLVGVWCYAASWLTRLPMVVNLLRQYGDSLIPYLLIGLGGMILWDSQTLADRGLTVIALLIGIGFLVSFSQRLNIDLGNQWGLRR